METLGAEILRKRTLSDADVPVPAVISMRACETPDGLAITDSEHGLRYADLEDRSNLLAQHLCAFGTGRHSVVGVCLKRSITFSICALAVMKAGAAYLPIDPSLPIERLQLLLRDADVDLTFVADTFRHDLSASCPGVIAVDQKGVPAARGLPTVSTRVQAGLDDLAYVIYTSGSTGAPKGVEITHRNLSNLAAWHLSAFEITAADRASHLARVEFDAAVWELWPYLAAGATVCIGDELTSKDPESLQGWLLEEAISVCFAAAPIAQQLMELEWPSRCPLRILLTGADTLHRYPRPRIPFRVINNYGPTECTVVATSGVVLSNENFERPPSIGRPIDNVRIHILDSKGKPVAEGDAGEIWISGHGVARGYRGRPDLTSSKFLRDPFSKEPGARMYASGDLGRALPNGEIQFLGRLDEQIKIRGHRVEPCEIESLLNQHPSVRHSAVVARQFDKDDVRLVAYLVFKTPGMAAPKEFQKFLADRLPQYAIPTIFVLLEELPLTGGGKTDRRVLSQLNIGKPLVDAGPLGPRTPLEERLTRIVEQLLKREAISVEDNFFLLGGHSLLGTQLISRVRDGFGVEISLRFLFEFPTVAALATEVERLVHAKVEALTDEEAERLLSAAHGLGPGTNGD
jgi:amino acid adenylation domain-containing protein